MKRMFQQVKEYKFDEGARNGRVNPNDIYKTASSFGTLENAIKDAEMWIYRTESWIDTSVVSIVIQHKETKEILWTYKA